MAALRVRPGSARRPGPGPARGLQGRRCARHPRQACVCGRRALGHGFSTDGPTSPLGEMAQVGTCGGRIRATTLELQTRFPEVLLIKDGHGIDFGVFPISLYTTVPVFQRGATLVCLLRLLQNNEAAGSGCICLWPGRRSASDYSLFPGASEDQATAWPR